MLRYLQDKAALKSIRQTTEHLRAIQRHYESRPLADLPAISREVIQENSEQATPLAAATIRQRLTLLKAACRHAWKTGMVEHDPTEKMTVPVVRNARHVYAGRQDVLRLARACDRWDARALVLIAFYTGMRLGELFRCSVTPAGLSLPDSKNGQPRIVPLHPRARRYAAKWLPLDAPKITLQRAVQRARKRSGMTAVRIHDLRHSAASEMVNAGVDLYTVGAVLGHRDFRSTQRYAHLATATLAEAVAKIGKSSHPRHKKAA